MAKPRFSREFSPCQGPRGWYVADSEGRLYEGGNMTRPEATARARELNDWAARADGSQR